MNRSKCNEHLYINFLLAAQKNYTCSFLSEISPNKMSHDSPTRFLAGKKLSPKVLWENVKDLVSFQEGLLILDDMVLDKPYSQKIDLVRWLWSGAHHRVVKGIGLTSLLWTGRDNEHIPIDYRIYAKDVDGKTKNEHAQEMFRLAEERGLNPEYVVFDIWFTGLKNLKTVRSLGWHWVGQFKANRVVSLKPHEHQHLEDLDIPPEGLEVHLKDYGFIKVFKFVSKNRGIEYYGTSDLNLSKSDVERIYGKRWKIEEYHRGLKQFTGSQNCQARKQRSQRNHIWLAIHSFVYLEVHRLKHSITWSQLKASIIKEAIGTYLKNPKIEVSLTAVP